MAGEITIGSVTGSLALLTDGTSYIRGRVNKSGRDLAGVTILLKYTKGDETSFTVSQGTIFPGISTTEVWKMPASLSGAISQATWTITGSGSWQLPIATQPYGIINLAISWTGSTSGTTAIVADIIYDTPDGLH
jgi:hypothetical protein